MVSLILAAALAAEPLSFDLKPILAVGREGVGQSEAAACWKRTVAAGPPALTSLLTAFPDASPAAANWLRTAVSAIADDTRRAGRKLPQEPLLAFAVEGNNHPTARRLAYELVLAQDKPAAEALLPKFLDDVSPELRRDAVAHRLAALGEKPAAADVVALFPKARDKDQVEAVAKLLEAAGQKPDLTRHFGYLTEWQLLGPLDGPKASGFAAKYPPDEKVDFAAKYPGKAPAGEVGWKPTHSVDKYGAIDLSVEVGKHKDAVVYAAAVLVADKETPVEVRLNSPNALRVSLNGVELFAQEEYHHGADHDQYTARGGVLKPGENLLLVKVCQNDQKEPWAQAWQFAARVCDRTGGAVPFKQIVVRDGKAMTVEPGVVRVLEPEPKKAEDKK